MKLLRINITKSGYERPVLDGFHEFFEPFVEESLKANPISLVGKNGTGKSQLLEVLARIFYFLDKKYRSFEGDESLASKIEFEFEYLFWDSKNHKRIKIENKTVGKKTSTKVFEINEDKEVEIPTKEVEKVLPTHIIGYSSGENETLSLPFLDTNYEYGDFVKKLGLEKGKSVPTTRLIFPDYTSNFSVFVANYLLRPNEDLLTFKEDELIQLENLHSFRIVIQLKHRAAPGKGVQLTNELQSSIEKLKDCATCFDYNEKSDSYTLDYFVNKATRDAFKHHFTTAFNLYMVFYKLDLLNSLIPQKQEIERVKKLRKQGIVEKLPTVSTPDKIFNISQIKLKLKNVPTEIDYIGLSDGQHQFVHVFGMMMMVDMDNVLFLLDEPETHFNPEWRSDFIKILNKITKNRHQEYITTTHSPFILSDSKSERIFIFEKDGTIRHPRIETYGASVETLLAEAFDIPIPISSGSRGDIEDLKRENDPDKIEEQLGEFGDSIEKFYLRRRIRELRKGEKKDK